MPLERKCFNLSLGATETYTYPFWRANSQQNAYFCAKETRTPSMPVCQMGRGFELTYEEEITTLGPANFMPKMSALMLWVNRHFVRMDVLSGRRFVRTALDVLSGRNLVRTALDVWSGLTCLRHFVRNKFCQHWPWRFVRTEILGLYLYNTFALLG